MARLRFEMARHVSYDALVALTLRSLLGTRTSYMGVSAVGYTRRNAEVQLQASPLRVQSESKCSLTVRR